jgi:hypothetical protein
MARYSDRPELWAQTNEISEEVWPEYNLHGAVLGRFWGRLREELPDFQFVLYDSTFAVHKPAAAHACWTCAISAGWGVHPRPG